MIFNVSLLGNALGGGQSSVRCSCRTHEGEWDEVMAVVKDATEAVGRFGTRVSLVLKADIRPGRTGELTGKVERLEAALGEQG